MAKVPQPEGPAAAVTMPPMGDGPVLSRFEFWPAWLFYAPVWLWILGLMIWHRGIRLPLIANPDFAAGGLVGEEKSVLFARLSGRERSLLPDYAVFERSGSADGQYWDIVAKIHAAGLNLPLVAKPDIGCRGAGVQPIRSLPELRSYIAGFPVNARFILQAMVDVEGEAGVFYVREPGAARGRIVSLTLKYFPHVVGDGRSTLRELILADPRAGKVSHLYLPRFGRDLDRVLAVGERERLVFSGSHSKGAIFRDGSAFVTEAMRARFDAIADAIDGYYFGRVDVRFADFAAFQRGEDFAIIEFNGAGAEMTHIWDSRVSLLAAWKALFWQFALLFRIGAANRRRGAQPESWSAFFRRWQRERSLVLRYPITR